MSCLDETARNNWRAPYAVGAPPVSLLSPVTRTEFCELHYKARNAGRGTRGHGACSTASQVLHSGLGPASKLCDTFPSFLGRFARRVLEPSVVFRTRLRFFILVPSAAWCLLIEDLDFCPSRVPARYSRIRAQEF